MPYRIDVNGVPVYCSDVADVFALTGALSTGSVTEPRSLVAPIEARALPVSSSNDVIVHIDENDDEAVALLDDEILAAFRELKVPLNASAVSERLATTRADSEPYAPVDFIRNRLRALEEIGALLLTDGTGRQQRYSLADGVLSDNERHVLNVFKRDGWQGVAYVSQEVGLSDRGVRNIIKSLVAAGLVAHNGGHARGSRYGLFGTKEEL